MCWWPGWLYKLHVLIEDLKKISKVDDEGYSQFKRSGEEDLAD